MRENFQTQQNPGLPLVYVNQGNGSQGEGKALGAFRTISEVATNLELPQHVLRFWETKFPQIKPLKRGGGRRYYRPEDVSVLNNIKDLLHGQGFTIRGVQKLLREGKNSTLVRTSATETSHTPSALNALASSQASRGLSTEKRRSLEVVCEELKALRAMLSQNGI